MKLKSSSNHKLKIEIALVHLIGLERTTTITELLSKLDRIEVKTDGKRVSDFSSGTVYPQIQINEPVKNVTPITKKELSLPKVESFIAPIADTSTDFSELVDKWKNFVDLVKNEKVFFWVCSS